MFVTTKMHNKMLVFKTVNNIERQTMQNRIYLSMLKLLRTVLTTGLKVYNNNTKPKITMTAYFPITLTLH